jgi:hypothetical protein
LARLFEIGLCNFELLDWHSRTSSWLSYPIIRFLLAHENGPPRDEHAQSLARTHERELTPANKTD